ncbi:unnamed protein product [Hymenolepis diminuta]|uniref:C2H2-type domain-containing protein n=1 Tax=Hymenolepis diminuta TaxID=6216 RepID=A0A0R3SKD6_HYMDI|nr:unnamed protein product [Hymenolepis diminuta]
MLRVSQFRFQPPDSGDGGDTFLLSPDIRFTSIYSNHLISTPSSSSGSSGLSNDGLPTTLNSPICHLLFRLAEASSWHGHFFLTGWYPSIDSSGTQEAVPSPPPAASFEEIQQAYEALLKDVQHPFSLASTMEGGTLRCMLCGAFRTDSCNSLRNHLTGCSNGADMATAKCALCSLSLVHNRRDTLMCSIKAHLLFHLDIYLFCPHCGFAPPPDLPPPLAEACLRLHLRFVCFHFNLVKVLLCSKPAAACRERVFLSVENFVQHWFEAHTTRKYGCQLCGTPHKLEEGVNDSPNRVNGTFEFPDLATICKHLQESHSLSSTSANTFSKIAYECSECPFISSIPVEFVDHFSLAHCRSVEFVTLSTNSGSFQNRQSPCEFRCYYRCFGLCRQIFSTLDELRSHMRTCVYALATLKQTLGDLLFNSSTPDELTQEQSSDIANREKNPLCLCLYCDVSTKSNGISLGKRNDSETQSSTDSSNSVPLPPDTFQSAKPFEDLQHLHGHEHTTHVTGSSLTAGGNQVGCPFCREKLTLKTSDSGSGIAAELLNHLRKHAMANPYVSWQMNRMRRFSEVRAGKFHFQNFNHFLGILTVSWTRVMLLSKAIPTYNQ